MAKKTKNARITHSSTRRRSWALSASAASTISRFSASGRERSGGESVRSVGLWPFDSHVESESWSGNSSRDEFPDEETAGCMDM
jgi:hypothetical protein